VENGWNITALCAVLGKKSLTIVTRSASDGESGESTLSLTLFQVALRCSTSRPDGRKLV
jgi:hypothetical protein